MNQTTVIHIAVAAMTLTAELVAPLLLGSLIIGLIISIFQAATQIQEITLTFVPKLAGVGLILALTAHWMLTSMITYTDHLFAMVPRLISGG